MDTGKEPPTYDSMTSKKKKKSVLPNQTPSVSSSQLLKATRLLGLGPLLKHLPSYTGHGKVERLLV